MIQIIVAVVISVLISTKITSSFCLRFYEENLNYHEKYVKQTVLNRIIIESLLVGKDKQQLLDLFQEASADIEKGTRA